MNEQLIKDVLRWIITTKNTEMLDESDIDMVYKDYVNEKASMCDSEHIAPVVRSNAATGWISVKDRLPEKGACVITFEPHCINNPDKGIGVCEVGSDFTDKKSDGNFWITHWMPLPETPEV